MIFDFDDINLIPNYSSVNSRSDCDAGVNFGGRMFKNPIVPANMESIINVDLCKKLAKNGYFYIMHRFDIDNVEFIKEMQNENLFTSISIGVNDDSYELIDKLKKENLYPDYITIDIAHGHCIKMFNMIKHVKLNLPESFLIAGNVSTVKATKDLDEWGADSIKIGIGPGSACSTYLTTGFGSRGIQASTINNCKDATIKPIIADGGITHPSDITKSIVLGAKMIMVGGMLSSYIDSPGKIIQDANGVKYKEFYGSASYKTKGKLNRIEGIVKLNKLKNITLLEQLNYLTECLQSSISYGGGNRLNDLYKVNWIKIK